MENTEHVVITALKDNIFAGYKDAGVTGRVRLLKASRIHRWNNKYGSCGFIRKDTDKIDYFLESVGDIEFALEDVLSTVKCEW
jgi:hypothetical protein